jgi:DNA repair exonuclease SbcCD ATPase subunit/DNA repair exonuclease SbcCD nuclease subunit
MLKQEKTKWSDGESGLIVLTGDIVHSKSQILPQLIIMLRDFLTNLSNIMPVIMIAGNHDLNLSNLDVPDTLSSILHKTHIEGLHYLKNSGVYIWNNISFGVMSVIDYPLIRAEEIVPGDGEDLERVEKKVGLLHATIHGSRICTSTTPLTSDKYKVGDFDGYDCVLLGDIHLHQFMNAKQTVAYAGSLIQQSFGEQLMNHGYLRWDLDSEGSMAKLVHVPNEYGFINLTMRNLEIGPIDLYSAIQSKADIIPKRVHVKVRMMDAEHGSVEIAEQFLKHMRLEGYEIEQELIIPYTPEDGEMIARQEGQSDDANNVDQQIPSLSNVEYQRRLIAEYLGEDHEYVHEIQDLHDQFYRDLDAVNQSQDGRDGEGGSANDSGFNSYNWDILNMEFHNTFSFKGTNYIDFSNFGGIMGIIGPNFSGKSNILDILLFALFDHASRGERNDIVTAGQTEMYIKLVFQIGSMTFTIHRIGKVTDLRDSTKTKIDVRFFNTQRDLTGENRVQTNRIIQSYIGTYDDFILTTLKLQQGGVGDLINLTNSARKERLVDLMRLNILDEYHAMGNNQFKDNKKAVDIYKKELDSIPGDLAGKLETVLDELIKSKTEMNSIKRQIDEGSNELNKLNARVQDVDMSLVKTDYIDEIPDVDVKSIREMDTTLNKLNEKIAQLQSSLKPLAYGMTVQELEENIDLYRATIVEHEAKIKDQENSERNDRMLLDALRDNHRDYKVQLKDWDELWKRKIELSSWLSRTKAGNEKLLCLEYDPKCKFCVNNPFVREAIECRDQLKDREKELEKIEIRVNELEGVKSDLTEVENEMEKIQLGLNRGVSAEMEREISNWNDELNGLRQDFKNIRANADLEDEIAEFNKQKIRIQDERDSLWEIWEQGQLMKRVRVEKDKWEANQQWNEKIRVLEEKMRDFRDKRDSLEAVIMKESAKSQMWTVQIEKQRELELKIKRLREENMLLEIYCKCLAKDGIPKFLIEKYMPEFERIVNLIMADLVNFKIKMDIADKKWNLYVDYAHRQLNIDLCSGYEKFIVGLAIKCALHHMSQISKPRFMIIDEGFGALDTQHMSEIGRMFNYLRSKYRFVLLITHIDVIKDELDAQLEIVRQGQYSHIDNRVVGGRASGISGADGVGGNRASGVGGVGNGEPRKIQLKKPLSLLGKRGE